MKNFIVYLKPEDGEPYRFVRGMRRRFLILWQEPVFSYLPRPIDAMDYAFLNDVCDIVKNVTGRDVVIEDADNFSEQHAKHAYYAVCDVKSGEWYTGKWYRTEDSSVKIPETTKDICDCQLFVRETYAREAVDALRRAGHYAVVEKVYVNRDNHFLKPCIVTVCVAKATKTTRYLRSAEGDKLTYTNSLDKAMVVYPEAAEELYDRLTSSNKELSFTMIVKPETDIDAADIQKMEKSLKQGIAGDYFIRKRKRI